MDEPAIFRLTNQVNSAAERLHRQTEAAIIAVAIADHDGALGVAFSVQGPTNTESEFALLTLLRALEKDVELGAAGGCAECVTRLERVAAAVGALSPGFPDSQQPMGTC